MRTKIALMSCLTALAALVPGAAWAQDTAPAAMAPAAPPSPDAPPSPPAAPAAPEAAPQNAAPAPEVAPAAPGEAPAAWPGWVRVDYDGGGIQLWGGATAPLGDGIGLAFDAYLAGSLGEFDIGPAISAGGFTITPMIGAQFNFVARTFAALVPQLYVTGGPDPIYAELWLQYYNYNSVHKYRDRVDSAADDYLYLRLFVDYKISDYVGVGPQFELTQDFTAEEMISMPIGANVFFFQAGAASTFQAFLGYETKKTFNDNHLAGRLSYVHNF
jgi:hypothetical protein